MSTTPDSSKDMGEIELAAIVDSRKLIKPIRAEIWQLVQEAKSMDIVHWLVALDDCFENDEFNPDEAENMRWRMMALTDKGVPTKRLYWLIDDMLPRNVKTALTNSSIKKGEV
jgi:hypothetical protein